MTYGDGVGDVDLDALLHFHRAHGKLATVTAVRPPARFGELMFDGDMVLAVHREAAGRTKAGSTAASWCSSRASSTTSHDEGLQPRGARAERLAADRQLAAYRHEGFWQCMDTLRDKRLLENLWDNGTRAVEGVDMNAFWRDRPTSSRAATGLVGGWLVAAAR